jgi:hypothetical protein
VTLFCSIINTPIQLIGFIVVGVGVRNQNNLLVLESILDQLYESQYLKGVRLSMVLLN